MKAVPAREAAGVGSGAKSDPLESVFLPIVAFASLAFLQESVSLSNCDLGSCSLVAENFVVILVGAAALRGS